MPLIINGQTIPPQHIQHEVTQIKTHHEQQTQTNCCHRDQEFLTQAKQNLINQTLLNQKAQTQTPQPTPQQINQQLTQLTQQHGNTTQLLLQAGLGPNDLPQLRQQIAHHIQLQQLLQQITPNTQPIPNQTLHNYYQQNIQNYTTPTRIKALHIYKSLRQTHNKETLLQQCIHTRTKLINGADFIQTAKQFTDKPHNEIDLGWFQRGDLLDEFEYVTLSMQIGEISPVFASHHGFHIAKLTHRQNPKPQPYQQIKNTILQHYHQHQQNKHLTTYLKTLRQNAHIQDLPDTPNQPPTNQPPTNHQNQNQTNQPTTTNQPTQKNQ